LGLKDFKRWTFRESQQTRRKSEIREKKTHSLGGTKLNKVSTWNRHGGGEDKSSGMKKGLD